MYTVADSIVFPPFPPPNRMGHSSGGWDAEEGRWHPTATYHHCCAHSDPDACDLHSCQINGPTDVHGGQTGQTSVRSQGESSRCPWPSHLESHQG
eukprot:symbB.v1.2.001088.t1/scaffold33.1/size517934/40